MPLQLAIGMKCFFGGEGRCISRNQALTISQFGYVNIYRHLDHSPPAISERATLGYKSTHTTEVPPKNPHQKQNQHMLFFLTFKFLIFNFYFVCVCVCVYLYISRSSSFLSFVNFAGGLNCNLRLFRALAIAFSLKSPAHHPSLPRAGKMGITKI